MPSHVPDVIDALVRGRVVAFLGAGVNLVQKGSEPAVQSPWNSDSARPPSGADLALYLAQEFRYPLAEECGITDCPLRQPGAADKPGNGHAAKPSTDCIYHEQRDLDLARVCQYGATRLGPGRLYEALTEIFSRQYSWTEVHTFLAGLIPPAAKPGLTPPRHLLIVTTNYDNLMERAFGTQPFDLVYFDPEFKETDAPPRARFLHRAPDRPPVPIDRPNEYDYPFLEKRPTILKIHGTVGNPVVITEDHYIDYLADEAFSKLPARLLSHLKTNHLLFLGYSLRDWNFRVFLRRIRRDRTTDYTSWAVVKSGDDEDTSFWWDRARVSIQREDLGSYTKSLQDELNRRGARP